MSQRSDTSSGGPDNPQDETVKDGLEDIVRPRLSRRTRLLRACALVALVLTVAAGLVWRSADAGASADTPPSGSTLLAPILVTSNVSGGAVTVNGQKQRGTPPVMIHLQPGRNIVTFDTSPFEPVPCIVIWPEATTSIDTPACGVAAISASESVFVGGKSMRVGGEITFSVSGSALPSAECAGALAAIAHALDTIELSTPVPPGQHIAVGTSSQEQVPFAQSAPAGLRARLTSQLEADGAGYGARPCDRLYANSTLPIGQDTPHSGSIWNVIVPITEDLAFVEANGKQVTPSARTDGTIQMNLMLPSKGSSDWQLAAVMPLLSTQIAANLCGVGSQLLAAVYHLAFPNVNGYSLSNSGAYSIEGCLMVLNASADNWETRATYLWRFGVLLATDAASHQLLPMLPMASAAELAAARASS